MASRKGKAAKMSKGCKGTKASQSAAPKGGGVNTQKAPETDQPEDTNEIHDLEEPEQAEPAERSKQPQHNEKEEQSELPQQLEESKQSTKSKKSKRLPRGIKRDWSAYSANLPDQAAVAKNGRVFGRVLIPWGRARMAEKLLLHIEYEALLNNVKLPWDKIAHRLSPGSSGAAVLQHMARMRKTLIAEGHMVPPVGQKPGGPAQPDASIRGYIRKYPDSTTNLDTRTVGWTEPLDDLTKPLGSAVYALPHDAAEDDGAAEHDRDGDENVELGQSGVSIASKPTPDHDTTRSGRSGRSARSARSVRSVRSARSARSVRPSRRVRAVKKISYDEGQDDAFSQDSGTEGDNEGEEPDVRDVSFFRAPRIKQCAASNRNVRRSASGMQPSFVSQSPGHYYLGPSTPRRHYPVEHHVGQNNIGGYGSNPYGGFMGLGDSFTTVESSPPEFNIADASPTTARNMMAHLGHWNSPTVLRNAGIPDIDMQLLLAGQNNLNGHDMHNNAMADDAIDMNDTSGPGNAIDLDQALTYVSASMARETFGSSHNTVLGTVGSYGSALASGITGMADSLVANRYTVPGSVSMTGSASMADNLVTNGHTMPGSVSMIGSASMADNLVTNGHIMPGSVSMTGSTSMADNLVTNGHTMPGSVSMIGSASMADNLVTNGHIMPGSVSMTGSASMADNLVTNGHTVPGSISMTGSASQAGNPVLPGTAMLSDDAFARMFLADGALDSGSESQHQPQAYLPSMFETPESGPETLTERE